MQNYNELTQYFNRPIYNYRLTYDENLQLKKINEQISPPLFIIGMPLLLGAMMASSWQLSGIFIASLALTVLIFSALSIYKRYQVLKSANTRSSSNI